MLKLSKKEAENCRNNKKKVAACRNLREFYKIHVQKRKKALLGEL
jgi:hypothetical protein